MVSTTLQGQGQVKVRAADQNYRYPTKKISIEIRRAPTQIYIEYIHKAITKGKPPHLTDSCSPRVAYTESLGSLSTEVSSARSGTVQDNVAHYDVFLGLEAFRYVLWWVDVDLATGKTLGRQENK